MLDAREALEILAVDKCIEKATPDQILSLDKILVETERALEAEKYARCNELDSRFHLEIAKISGNKKLIEFCREIEDHMRIARAVDGLKQGRGAAVIMTAPDRALPLLREAYRAADGDRCRRGA